MNSSTTVTLMTTAMLLNVADSLMPMISRIVMRPTMNIAGTEESPGEAFLLEGRRFKIVRGMGSLGAMQEGSADRYFQESDGRKFVPEGIEGRVPYRGPVADVIFQMVGGLRSGMGYCGVSSIPQLQCEVEMVQITSAGLRESHPHDVTITREAPNYSA